MPEPMIHVASVPAPGGKLTKAQWAQIEKFLEEWKRETMAAVRKHPARSYAAGKAQVEAFAKLLGRLGTVTVPPATLGSGPTAQQAAYWVERTTLHELDDSLNRYVGNIKDKLLYGLQGAWNPVDVASALYRATKDAEVNWRAIARTEMVRAMAHGRLDASEQMGYDRVWCPPHAGACGTCRRLIENRVFTIAQVRGAAERNIGRKMRDWEPAIPQHPHCRHAWLPYEQEVAEDAIESYRQLEEAGLADDDTLDAMFEESGQLRPEYENDPRLRALKTRKDVGKLYEDALAGAVTKARTRRQGQRLRTRNVKLADLRTDLYQRAPDPAKVDKFAQLYRDGDDFDPPVVSKREDRSLWLVDGQHRALGAQQAGRSYAACDVRTGLSWEDEQRICREAMGEAVPRPAASTNPIGIRGTERGGGDSTVGKGYFDPPQLGLDPALWEDDALRREAHSRLTHWATEVLGRGWHRFAHLFLTGGATSHSWLSHPERDSDVDLQIVVDWDRLRRARKSWAKLSDSDLHYALVAAVKAGLEEQEVVPGVRLDAFVRPEQSVAQFEGDAKRSGQAVWDVLNWRWISRGVHALDPEVYGSPWLEGIGAEVALEHPDWLDDARAVVTTLQAALDGYLEEPTEANRRALAAAYLTLHDARRASYSGEGGEEGRGNFLFQYAVNFGPLMQVKHLLLDTHLGKVWPGYAWAETSVEQVGKMSPSTGIEHWITVHPHGESEPGQPVLVRNNSDGTMSVIGGAGGSLNYLRLDPKRRIDDKKEKANAKQKANLSVEEPISEEERQRQEAEFEQRKAEARQVIEATQSKRDELDERLRDYAGSIGYHVDQAHIKHASGEEETADATKSEQRDALRKLTSAALHTLAHGEISRKDANDSPWLIERKHGDFEGMEDKKDGDQEGAEPREEEQPNPDVESTPEEELQRAKRSLAKLPPLTPEQAQAIMELHTQANRLRKQQSKARKVLREGGEHTDSMALDWRDADVKDEVARRVADERRTDIARELVATSENPRSNPGKVRFGRALRDGAYDSVDAFTHAVLGTSAIPPAVGRLLGAAGSAQLAAYAIRKRAEESGGIDLQKALDALEEHTQRHELEVAQTALARARAAADTAVQMREERKLSEAGDSLWLQSMTRSYEQAKMGEAARLLGMAIGGCEASSAMKVALSRPADKLKVTGFESAASIKELARKAGVEVGDEDITRVGGGDYTLSLDPQRLEGLLRYDPEPNGALRERLQQLRSGHALDDEVEAAKSTPGMADTLDDAQARGKLVLQATADAGGGCVLAFAPGRGKTHTALAAALQRMTDEGVPPGQGNTWIVCPTTAMAEWAGTIKKNCARSVQMIGKEFEHTGGGVIESRQKGGKHTQGQLETPADFNIISVEHLQSLMKRDPELADKIKASRVIADESQKSKNEKADRWQTLNGFAKHTTERWALSGTTIEKKVRDLGAQYHWANPERSLSPAAMEEKYGKLGQEPHVLGQDKVQQFREGLDEGLYQLGADDQNLPERTPTTEHKIALDPEHEEALKQTAQSINEQRAEARARGQQGISGIDAERIMRQGLYERPHNALAREVSSIVDAMDDVDYEGDENGENAGTYAPKAIVFSQFVKQLDHVVDELQGGDAKVFYAHGGMSSEENDKQLKDFIAHKGRAVLVSSDKNSTARSLQFGKNKGEFQNGATTMIHYSQPDNNATIQQREARIRRKGSAVPVNYHTLNAGTPAETRQKDRLERERRTQELAGNSEQLVGGSESLAQGYARATRETP